MTVKHNSHIVKKTIGFGLGDVKKYEETGKKI
jgi:hypothetical protein